ncbi:Protein of unknown function [Cotesia congregata]|uniref:Uncharacterized protein n=1 Tax=Cotesia congregata TaxID=51543 RepID=A0A8J2E7L5_COTCN|nr:Protein of unknown function [Cotesia congregata]
MIAAKLLIFLTLTVAISISRRIRLSSTADDFKWIAKAELQKYLTKIESFGIHWKLEDFGSLMIRDNTLDILGTERVYHFTVTIEAIKPLTYDKGYEVEGLWCFIDLHTKHLPADIRCKIYHTDGVWNDIMARQI